MANSGCIFPNKQSNVEPYSRMVSDTCLKYLWMHNQYRNVDVLRPNAGSSTTQACVASAESIMAARVYPIKLVAHLPNFSDVIPCFITTTWRQLKFRNITLLSQVSRTVAVMQRPTLYVIRRILTLHLNSRPALPITFSLFHVRHGCMSWPFGTRCCSQSFPGKPTFRMPSHCTASVLPFAPSSELAYKSPVLFSSKPALPHLFPTCLQNRAAIPNSTYPSCSMNRLPLLQRPDCPPVPKLPPRRPLRLFPGTDPIQADREIRVDPITLGALAGQTVLCAQVVLLLNLLPLQVGELAA